MTGAACRSLLSAPLLSSAFPPACLPLPPSYLLSAPSDLSIDPKYVSVFTIARWDFVSLPEPETPKQSWRSAVTGTSLVPRPPNTWYRKHSLPALWCGLRGQRPVRSHGRCGGACPVARPGHRRWVCASQRHGQRVTRGRGHRAADRRPGRGALAAAPRPRPWLHAAPGARGTAPARKRTGLSQNAASAPRPALRWGKLLHPGPSLLARGRECTCCPGRVAEPNNHSYFD